MNTYKNARRAAIKDTYDSFTIAMMLFILCAILAAVCNSLYTSWAMINIH